MRETLVDTGLSVLTMDEFPAMGKDAGQGSNPLWSREPLRKAGNTNISLVQFFGDVSFVKVLWTAGEDEDELRG